MIRRLPALLGTLGVLAASAPAGAETILQNDSLEEMFSGTTASARLIEGEMYEAVFDIPEEWLPVEMLGVRVVMVESNSAEDPTCPPPCSVGCASFGLEVWEEGMQTPLTDSCIIANVRYKDPGVQVFTQTSVVSPMGDEIGFVIQGDPTRGSATYKDLRFSAINQIMGVTLNPVILNTSRVRIGLRAMSLQCTGNPIEGDHFPVLLTDLDNVADPLTNFVYGEPLVLGSPICTSGSPQHYAWEDFAPAFQASTPGDFIIRLILNHDDGMVDPPDVGLPDGGMDMADMSSTDMQVSDDMTSTPDMPTPDMSAGDMTEQDDTGGEAMGDLEIDSITPDEGQNDGSTDVVIVGSGFVVGAKVALGDETIGVTDVAPTTIQAVIPEGLEVGPYDVVVENPDGATAVLEDGFNVVAPGSTTSRGGGDDGCCRQVSRGDDRLGLTFALLALGLVLRRRARRSV